MSLDVGLLYEVSKIWVPDFPRQVTFSGEKKQKRVNSRSELVSSLSNAAANGGPGFVSAYSFPNGHSKDGNIPKVDTLFLDLDIPKNEGVYHPGQGGTKEEWMQDMSKLLVRAKLVARTILDAELEDHVRVTLSGHKGIHIYIDFEAVSNDLGSIDQYKNGLASYANQMLDFFAKDGAQDIHKWVDVTSDDLGRLARHPNTPHHGAKHVDRTPYCVASSVKELATMTPSLYLAAIMQPRPPIGSGRNPSAKAHSVVEQNIEKSDSSTSRSITKSKHRDEDALNEYKQQSNDSIDLETVEELLVKNKPCIMAWRERDDAYDYGQHSRDMEINVIKKLAKHDVPIDVIVDFFRPIPGFDEEYSINLIEDIIARYHPSSFVCKNVINSGGEFCLGESCSVYQRNDDLDLHNDT